MSTDQLVPPAGSIRISMRALLSTPLVGLDENSSRKYSASWLRAERMATSEPSALDVPERTAVPKVAVPDAGSAAAILCE